MVGWNDLPKNPEDCNDPKTFALLAAGNTKSVFQLDSDGMQRLLRKLKPTCFDDISAVLSLYRPGPMAAKAHEEYAKRKNENGGKWQSAWAIHPDFDAPLRDVVAPSFGLVVWQETVLDILKVVCSWDYGDAALLFDAMRKKNTEKMLSTRPAYTEAGVKNGFSEEAMDALWEILVPFSDYSFCRAHSAGYALIAYWTAYLKAHHPNEYFASVLTQVVDDADKFAIYVEDAKQNGVHLLPPDLVESGAGFTPTKSGVRYGLTAVKGVGESIISELTPSKTIEQFYAEVPEKMNTRVLDSLIRAGALDRFGSRVEHQSRSTEFLELAKAHRKAKVHGDTPIIGASYSISKSQANRKIMKEWESELIGMSLTSDELRAILKQPLTEEDWFWINDVLSKYPGLDSLKFELNGVQFSACQTVSDSAMLRKTLNANTKVEVISE